VTRKIDKIAVAPLLSSYARLWNVSLSSVRVCLHSASANANANAKSVHRSIARRPAFVRFFDAYVVFADEDEDNLILPRSGIAIVQGRH
jgi:hypothetical protein